MVDNACRHSMQVMYAAVLQAILVSTAQKVTWFLGYIYLRHQFSSFFGGCSFCLFEGFFVFDFVKIITT